MTRYCIIGARHTVLAVATTNTDLGLNYDRVEPAGAIGGNWSHRANDSTKPISSKDIAGYSDYPMPAGYPDFPSAAQMREYLRSFAAEFGLDHRTEFNTLVADMTPLDTSSNTGWRVEFGDGTVREYVGVVIANGHYWDVNIPAYLGEFPGKQIHSKNYKRPAKRLHTPAGDLYSHLPTPSGEALAGGPELRWDMRRGRWSVLATTQLAALRSKLVGAPVAPSTSARNPEQPVVPDSVSRQILAAAHRNT